MHAAAPPAVAFVQRSVAREVRAHAHNVVVIVMEDRRFGRIVGNAQAPYLNSLLSEAAVMTDAHAVAHPSQPNYLALFSGSTQGVTDDSCPHTFTGANLATEAIAAGWTFNGASESMPRDGFRGCGRPALEYTRAHNPWVDFATVPASSNIVWFDIPARFGGLPAFGSSISNELYIIAPNTCNDMERCSTTTGDNWLKANLSQILIQQDATDGLTIVAWDEAVPDNDGRNHVPLLLFGPMIVPGTYRQRVDHYSVLRTIEDVAGLPCIENDCSAAPLRGMFR